jgi:hypothetical protein
MLLILNRARADRNVVAVAMVDLLTRCATTKNNQSTKLFFPL